MPDQPLFSEYIIKGIIDGPPLEGRICMTLSSCNFSDDVFITWDQAIEGLIGFYYHEPGAGVWVARAINPACLQTTFLFDTRQEAQRYLIAEGLKLCPKT